MAVEIAPIRPEHIEGFHRALDTVARERRYLAFTQAPPIDSTRTFVMNNIAKGYPQCVALQNGELVGWCDTIPHSNPERAHNGTLGMGLLPTHRGQGIGTSLLEATLERARAFGLTRIELQVRSDNTPAIALYRKLGFATEGIKRDAIRADDRYLDLMFMALLFDRP